MLFSEPVDDSGPINSIVIIEFKRPQRDDYDDERNPLLQVFEQIKEIRGGHAVNMEGRPIRVANTKIPAYAYVICDITKKLEAVLLNSDAQPTPDNRSFYGYHRNNEIYYEVIDYSKIVEDAKKRNRIFFERLNINF